MSAPDASKELASLLKKARAQHPDAAVSNDAPSALDPSEPLLALFLRSFLMWDAPAAKAQSAMRKIEQSLVDYNELRVCLPDELVAIIGERYPKAGDRALRIRSALTALYTREHAVTLESLPQLGAQQAVQYLLTLNGTPHYVASRVALVGLGAHAAPVDSRLLHCLMESKVVPKAADAPAAAAALESLVAPGEMLETHALLQHWADHREITLEHHEPARVVIRPISKEAAEPPAPEPKRKNGKSPATPRGSGKSGAGPEKKRSKSEK